MSYIAIEKPARGETYELPGKFGVYRYSDGRHGWVNDYQQKREFLGAFETLIEAVRAYPGADIPTDV